jgi:hypothetical protein
MDQAAQRTFIRPEARRLVERPQPRPARRANALLIERPRVEKRSITNGAREIRLERFRRRQTLFADRNARPLYKRTLANPAIIGKKQREKSVRNLADEMEGSRSRYRTTREGAPP